MTYDDVINKIRTDLAWRGPNSKSLGHIVLTRDEAELLLYPQIKERVTEQQLKEALTMVAELKRRWKMGMGGNEE